MLINKVLYFSSVIFEEEQGFSINEFEFCKALFDFFKDNCWFVLHIKNKSRITKFMSNNNNYIFFNNIRLLNVWSAIRLSIIIYNHVKKNNINIIITRITEMPIVIFLLIFIFNIKVVVKTAGTTYCPPQKYNIKDKIYLKISSWLRKYVLENAFAVDAPTEELCKLVKDEVPTVHNIIVVENGTNIDTFKIYDKKTTRLRYRFSMNDIILGFVGAVPSEDGAKQMIHMLPKLLLFYPNIKIVIVGEDVGIMLLKDFVKNMHLAEIVFFLGKIPYSEVPEIISIFDIGFSLVPKYILERNGNSSQKVRQYLACGVPVVSVHPGHDFIEQNSFLGETVIDPENIQEIEEKTLSLLLNIKNNKLGNQQLIRKYAVKNLSINKTLQKRLDFWSNLYIKYI